MLVKAGGMVLCVAMLAVLAAPGMQPLAVLLRSSC